MAISIREPLIRYLHTQASILRRSSRSRSAVETAQRRARALELLADHVASLADDDERLLMLGTLAIRGGDFTPGAGAEDALNRFTGTDIQECEAFLTRLSQVARDDALARAREFGFLPPRPR